MSIKVSGFSSAALDYKIIYFNNQTNPSAAIQENVTGTSGRFYSVEIDNKSGSPIYARLYDGSAPVLGTTAAHWVFPAVASQSVKRVEIPGGIPFSTSLNLWTTKLVASKDNTVPAAQGCTVTIITS
tara:strand:+ start:127 stop:507 length:381 start_codon:yes stop_codon:yes gene_type:complete